MWQGTKGILPEAAEVSIGFRKHVKRISWISEEMFDLIYVKREAILKDNTLYKQFKAGVQRQVFPKER